MTEAEVEELALAWFQGLGYKTLHGAVIAPDGEAPERESWSQVVLATRLREAIARVNLRLEAEAREAAFQQVMRMGGPSIEETNLACHRVLAKGLEVETRAEDRSRGAHVWLVDFERPERNDWLVVQQLTVKEGRETRRPDLVVYLNGLPVAVFELKNPADESATLDRAWNQLRTYRTDIPGIFAWNQVLAISDGLKADFGSLTAGREWFGAWRSVDGSGLAPAATPQLRVLIEGLFEPARFAAYLRHFVLWETDKGCEKKLAGYHQFFAVEKAVAATVKASRPEGDRRIGVVWHTQGSGKSISMCFYAARVIAEPAMENPTLVVLTDRNDLDEQLFKQFCKARELVPTPVQAGSREALRELLKVASGGVVFSTLQKFGTPKGERMPLLSDRRNIVVIADEAHRSHYEFIEGLARNLRDALPNASFVGFTGTPIELDDKSTPAVFGDYVDTYTIAQAVADGRTVPIHYEARLAKIRLPEDRLPRVDEEFEELTEAEEEASREKLKGRWARLEALVGTEERLSLVASDLLAHWEERKRILAGKAMVVVMSRRIAVDLYDRIVALRPDWHSDDEEEGRIKIVMTGSADDPQRFQPHIANARKKSALGARFKDPEDPLELVIVRDMWLTGFDVPCAHTLYVDKPMKGHGLMQAIARVNRVFKDKPAGLVVDYLGLAEQLRKAVGVYGRDPGNRPAVPVDEALALLRKEHGVARDQFHGFDFSGYFSGDKGRRLGALAGGADHVLKVPDGKKRFLDVAARLGKAAAMAIHLEEARPLRDEVGYFQAVEATLRKTTPGGGAGRGDLDQAIRQILTEAVTTDGVIDVFGAAGIAKPDLSILSDEFLRSMKASPYKNLQLEVLRKLLSDEIKALGRRNVVQARKFSEMLEATLLRYQNRTLEAAEVILELIDMAKAYRAASARGATLGLTEDELAFYDALADHGEVRKVMTDAVLAKIAHDLVEEIRRSVSIDWSRKESVRAKLRTRIKRLLRKHGYPPDKREEAVRTVLEQAEQVCRDWGEAA